MPLTVFYAFACCAIQPKFPSTKPDMKVISLRCEQQVDPLGIEAQRPSLSWQIKSDRRGVHQSKYRVLVASSAEKLNAGQADIWDSGEVKSPEISVNSSSAAKSDTPRTFYWKVRVWDEKDVPSDWSKPAKWTTGLTDWRAQWIEKPVKQTFAPVNPFDDDPAPLLRKSFKVTKPVAKAILSIAGLGYFEPHLNGKKVGDHELDPGWTDFSKRVSYSTFDVTKQLKPGENVLGAMLGNGFFNPLPLKMWGHLNLREHLPIGNPRLVAQLEIQYQDGTKDRVITDPSWQCSDGPVIRNSVYLGEVYDARAEQSGWDAPGFNADHWGKAKLVPDTNTYVLKTAATPPIRVTKVLKPIQITEPRPGVFIVDFGQNFAGVTRMRVKGPAGTRVRLRSGELLYKDGTLNGMTSVAGQHKGGGKDYVYDGKGEPKTAFQIDEYICKGKGTEVFQPRFTFHGFRYVEVTGYPGKPKLEDFEGLRMNSDVEKVGSFECSNPMFNRIQTMVEWTLLSNLFSVQSDCPHREKFGYGGDQVATSEMAMYTFDMQRFYANTAHLLAETIILTSKKDQIFFNYSPLAERGVTETAPYVGIADDGLGGKTGPIEWGSALPMLMVQLHEYYQDRRVAQTLVDYEGMWIGTVFETKKIDSGISDHESLVTKPQALTFQAFKILNFNWLADLSMVASDSNRPGMDLLDARVGQIVLGSEQDSANTRGIANLFTLEFNKRFLKPDGKYDIGTQCCQAMPLALGLVPEGMKAKVLDVLLKDIKDHDYHLTTGIFGTKYLFEALSDNGHDDVAYKIANQKTFPGWGHMLENGATTLWEHWEFSDNTFSHNHPMFGSISEWFYRSLLGIRPAKPGFKETLIKPSVVGDLTWAKGHHDCPYGRIEASWKRENNQVTLDVTIPANTTATVIVPGHNALTDNDECVERMGESTFKVQSGHYRFTSQL